jgi:iron complex transport system substrate-binding protein
MLARALGIAWLAVCASIDGHAAGAQRVVSLAPHATELVAAAGGADRLVGITQSCTYPDSVKTLPKISGASGVNIEKLVSLKPDLVVVWPGGNRPQDIERIKGLGLAILISEPKSVDDIALDIERLGQAMGTQLHAQAASSALREQARQLQAMGSHHQGVTRAFYQLGAGQLYTLNDAHPVTQVLRMCGGKNVFGGLPMLAPQVSVEAVAKAKPDAIIVASPQDADEVKQFWESRRTLFGARFPAFVVVEGERLHRPTPRMLPAARAMCDALKSLDRR